MAEQVPSPDITSDDKLWSALGYPIALIAIIVLLMEAKRDRPFIKYHLSGDNLNIGLGHHDHSHITAQAICAW
jgi:hypothetical protein